MNIFTVDVTVDGRTQITFGNSHAIQTVLPQLLMGLCSISAEISPKLCSEETPLVLETPIQVEPAPTTRARKRGRPKKIVEVKQTLTQLGITEYQHEWERQRAEIKLLYMNIRDRSNKFSGLVYKDFGARSAHVWDYYYKIFEEKLKTELREEVMQYNKSAGASKLNHILKMNKGDYFKSILQVDASI